MLVEHPDPVAAAGQVIVRNTWIGVNYVDRQHRAGRPYPVRLPLIPGTEAAGTGIAERFPLGRASEAHARLAGRTVPGTILSRHDPLPRLAGSRGMPGQPQLRATMDPAGPRTPNRQGARRQAGP